MVLLLAAGMVRSWVLSAAVLSAAFCSWFWSCGSGGGVLSDVVPLGFVGGGFVESVLFLVLELWVRWWCPQRPGSPGSIQEWKVSKSTALY